MSNEFKARPSTIMKAINAMRKAEYPKRAGEPSGERDRWQEHHNACLKRLTDMFYGERVS